MVKKRLEDINANRMELLIIRKRIALAEKGHKLLSEKRDAMVMQFLSLLETYESTRKNVLDNLQTAYDAFLETELIMGQLRLADLANRMPTISALKLSTKNIIGVTIPAFDSVELKPLDDFQYGIMDTPAKLDESLLKYREVLPEVIRLSVAEASLERMAQEIEKTKRRVNALEYIFIPRLKSTKRYIEMQLQEREREDFFRRKRIKELMQAQT